METFNKVLLYSLPAALETVRAEQLQPEQGLVLTRDPDAAPDVIVAAAPGMLARDFPGVPVLALAGRGYRLAALVRQAQAMAREPALYLDDIALGGARLSPAEKALAPERGDEVALTEKETDILLALVRARGARVARETLLRKVWGYQDGIDTHTLETHVYRLRQKMEAAGIATMLETDESGGGYRLKPT